MNTTLDEDLDNLSKKLYLESPDLWIDFLDKINDKIFDEMVLFFALKYNFPSIVRYTVDNNQINLDDTSKNKAYSSVRNHLIATAKQYNCDNILAYLGDSNNKKKTIPKKNLKSSNLKESITYSPTFICTKCSSNIFDCGYKVTDNTIYKFCPSKNKLIETTNTDLGSIICCNCNTIIDNVTVDKLKSLCDIQTCNDCGSNLTKVGILDKVKMEYDKDTNKFISKSTSYHCYNCDSSIKESQKIHFNL